MDAEYFQINLRRPKCQYECLLFGFLVIAITGGFMVLYFTVFHKTPVEEVQFATSYNDQYLYTTSVDVEEIFPKVKVCMLPEAERTICTSLEREGSQAVCSIVESRVECAIKIARGEVDFGVFTEEETLLLGIQQPNINRVVATIRDVTTAQPNSFEAVAVVHSTYVGGLEGLRGGNFCHPGFDIPDTRWSPRVLKAFEQAVAQSDRCPGADTAGKSADELEVEVLNGFFRSACRPGPWSANSTVDANLKNRFPNLCALCGTNNNCTGYSINMGAAVAGVNNDNRHIQALECLRSNGNGSVAYVAWQHVREYFTIRNPELATSFALLAPDGTTTLLRPEILAAHTSPTPSAYIKQPWRTVIANANVAAALQTSFSSWWPGGVSPGAGTWQATLFNGIVGGASARINVEAELPSPNNYTASIRNIPSIDSTTCLPTRRWCTISAAEQVKCNWVRMAAHILGIQPTISCIQRNNVIECLRDIGEGQVDFIASSSNYGYLARQHYKLSPVKLLQNSRNAPNAFSRVAAFVKETSAQNSVTRFENLRDKRACFPEFGGIAYVAFVRTAQERGIISSSECDYARAVGEFFSGACAPGALDASHALSESSSFNSTGLCTACRPRVSVVGTNPNITEFTCAWDYSNLYFGNNGSLSCLADPNNDVAFVQTQNIQAHLTQLNLQPSQFRALCRNNTLAVNPGVTVDDNCLLALVVDAEVVTRRNDPLLNAINVLLDTVDFFFGYTAEAGVQLINLEIFSPFDGTSDLLFKDTAIGLTEPSANATNEQVRNYMELFRHLESCTGAAAPTPGFASRNIYSLVTLVVMTLMTRFVVY